MNANEFRRLIVNLIRKGSVLEVDLTTNPPTCRVSVGDPAQGVALAGLNSESFPAPSSSADKHLRAYPDGAQLEYDHAAHALTATLPAGATVLIVAPGAVTVQTKTASVQADDITLDARQTTVTGSMLVKGAFEFQSGMTGSAGEGGGSVMKIKGASDFDGEVKSQGISLPHHKHREQGDGELLSEPQ